MATRKSFSAEATKGASGAVRRRLAAALADPSPGFATESEALLRLHGIRHAGELQFTLRVRIPAGRLTAAQYLALDDIADRHGDGTLRLTRHQGIEIDGVLKRDLKEAIGEIVLARLTTLGAGGDVARAVTAAAPGRDPVQRRLEEEAQRLSAGLLPRPDAYAELWLDGARAADDAPDAFDGDASLPRKLEIGLAVPEDDAIDVLGHDLALVAHPEDGRIAGYTLALGGSPLAFIAPQDLLAATLAAVALFRDHGDRSERGQAPLDQLVAARGAAWIKAQLEDELGNALAPPRPLPPLRRRDHIGWHDQGDGKLYLGLAVPGGRITDAAGSRLRTALRLICRSFAPSLLLLPRQGIILGDIAPADRLAVATALGRFGAAPALAGDAPPAWQEAS